MKTQTVVYQFPVLNTLANNTLTSIGSVTANFSGISGVSVVNAFIVLRMSDIITATGGSITTKRIDLNVNNAGAVTTSDTTTYSHTYENIFLELYFDVTSNVSTNILSNTNNTFDLSLLINQSTGTTLGMNNVCAELYITYQFDETISTRALKTVFIPIGYTTDALPTTSTSYGTIPALSSYLPESSKSFDNLAIIAEANIGGGNTDVSLTMSLTGGLTTTSQLYEQALFTARKIVYHWKLDTSTFDYLNNLTLSANSNAIVLYSCVFYMIATYSYELSTTTSVMNSLLLGNVIGFGGSSSSLFDRCETELIINETNVIAKRFMALVYYSSAVASSNVYLRINPASAFTGAYNVPQSMSASMIVSAIHDDTLALSSGKNTLILDYYSTDSTPPKGGNVLWIVNYTSDSVNGGLNNNKTLITQVLNDLAQPQRITSSTKICPISENDYYLVNGIFYVNGFTAAESNIDCNICIEILASEGGISGGLIYFGTGGLQYTDKEAGNKFHYIPLDFDKIKRFVGDIRKAKLISVEQNRNISVVGISLMNVITYTTYHTITKSISGLIKNNANQVVSGADVYLVKLDNNPIVMKKTTSDVNGNYSFTVYDNESNYFIYAHKSGTPNIFDATDKNLSGA